MRASVKIAVGTTPLEGHFPLNLSSILVQISPLESEALEIQFDDEGNEIRVIRHGMGIEDGGECVYSVMLEEE